MENIPASLRHTAGTNEIILYQGNEIPVRLEVRLANDSVWLNRNQIAELFHRDVKTIGKHINNIFREQELDTKVVVAKFATTTSFANSPSEKILLICFPIVFISLPKSKANCCRFNQTVSLSKRTSIRLFVGD
jgi:hypothetical protein